MSELNDVYSVFYRIFHLLTLAAHPNRGSANPDQDRSRCRSILSSRREVYALDTLGVYSRRMTVGTRSFSFRWPLEFSEIVASHDSYQNPYQYMYGFCPQN
jgi:hypothetical protein